jgi:hypothetical protein
LRCELDAVDRALTSTSTGPSTLDGAKYAEPSIGVDVAPTSFKPRAWARAMSWRSPAMMSSALTAWPERSSRIR